MKSGQNLFTKGLPMQDFDEFVRSLVNRNHAEMIADLEREDTKAHKIVRYGRRAKRDSPERRRAEEAQEWSNRCGRILFFLRHGVPADRATAVDLALCSMLAEKLQTK